jgi:hypothetical protein
MPEDLASRAKEACALVQRLGTDSERVLSRLHVLYPGHEFSLCPASSERRYLHIVSRSFEGAGYPPQNSYENLPKVLKYTASQSLVRRPDGDRTIKDLCRCSPPAPVTAKVEAPPVEKKSVWWWLRHPIV